MDWHLAVLTGSVIAGWLIGKTAGLVIDAICKWKGIDNKSYWKGEKQKCSMH